MSLEPPLLVNENGLPLLEESPGSFSDGPEDCMKTKNIKEPIETLTTANNPNNSVTSPKGRVIINKKNNRRIVLDFTPINHVYDSPPTKEFLEKQKNRRHKRIKTIDDTDTQNANNVGYYDAQGYSVKARSSLQERPKSKKKDVFEPINLVDIAPDRNKCYDDLNANIDRGMPGNPLEKEIEEQEAREAAEQEEDKEDYECHLQDGTPLEPAESPLEPEVLIPIKEDRNGCYDNVTANIDRGMPGHPLEKEIEEQEAREAAEQEEDKEDYECHLQDGAPLEPAESPLEPEVLIPIKEDRNGCYDNVTANIDRGMPGHPLEKEIEEQEARELAEQEEDKEDYECHLQDGAPLEPAESPLEPEVLVPIKEDRNGCYDNVTANIDRGMPGHPLEKEIEEQEARELAEQEEDKEDYECHLQDGAPLEPAESPLEPEVLIPIKEDRNGCYDNVTANIDRGMPGHPLEKEIGEQEAREVAEQENDTSYYSTHLKEKPILLSVVTDSDVRTDSSMTHDWEHGKDAEEINLKAAEKEEEFSTHSSANGDESAGYPYDDLTNLPSFADAPLGYDVLIPIKEDRNGCYDNVTANVDRGMPGHPLEKEIEEQEAREAAEHENDTRNYRSLLYPESVLGDHFANNMASEVLRNEFGTRTEEGMPLLRSRNVVSETEIFTDESFNNDLEHGKDAEEINTKKATKDEKNKPLSTSSDEAQACTFDAYSEAPVILGEGPLGYEVLIPIKEDRNGCYDNITANVDRGMPGHPLEKEIEEQEAREAAEQEDDDKHYRSLLYPDSDDLPKTLNVLSETEIASDTSFNNYIEHGKDAEEINTDRAAQYEKNMPVSTDETPTRSLKSFNELPTNLAENPLGYEVLVPITEDRNGCYDNVTANVDRGMPGHPLEKEIEEQESREAAEQEDDNQHYQCQLQGEPIEPTEGPLGYEVLVPIKEDRNGCYDNVAANVDRGMPGHPLEKEIEEQEGREAAELEEDTMNYQSHLNEPEVQIEEEEEEPEDITEEALISAEAPLEPEVLVQITQDRNGCYDNVAANVDRGMPGHPLEKEIEEQEARELAEQEDDNKNYQCYLQGKPAELTEGPLGYEVLVPITEDRNGCYDNFTANVDRGMPGHPLEKEIEEQESREAAEQEDDSKHYRSLLYPESAIEKHNENNFASEVLRNEFGNRPEEPSILENLPKSLNVLSETEIATDTSFNNDIEHNKDAEEVNTSKAHRDEINEPKSSDEINEPKQSEESLPEDLPGRPLNVLSETEIATDTSFNNYIEHGKDAEEINTVRAAQYEKNMPVSTDETPTRSLKSFNELPTNLAENPLGYEVLVPITEDRNGCYDNVTANVDRGMPGHPLEKEIEEQESREAAEQEDDCRHYRSLLYPESAIEKHNENNFASEVLRNEFGNRPEEAGILENLPKSLNVLTETEIATDTSFNNDIEHGKEAEEVNTSKAHRDERLNQPSSHPSEAESEPPARPLENLFNPYPLFNEALLEPIVDSPLEPTSLITPNPDRNGCYDGINVNADRGMPGNQLEKELEEQAVREAAENAADSAYYQSLLYPESVIAAHFGNNFASEVLRNEFGTRPDEVERPLEDLSKSLNVLTETDIRKDTSLNNETEHHKDAEEINTTIAENDEQNKPPSPLSEPCDLENLIDASPLFAQERPIFEPEVLVPIKEDRNGCYDNVAANVDRGMPGHPLEKEIEEQESREAAEQEEDANYYASLLPQEEEGESLLAPISKLLNAVTESELETNTSVTQEWEHGKDVEEINAANAEKEENNEQELFQASEAGSESQKIETESEADNKPAGALENLIDQRALFGEQPTEEKQAEEEEKQGEEEKQAEEEEKQGEEEKQAEEEEKQAEEIHIEEEEDPEKEEQQEPGALEKLINQQALFGEQPKQAEEIPSEEQAEQQELEKAPEEEEAVINEGPLGYEVLIPITEDRNGCYDNVTANVDRGMPGHPLEKEIEEQESRELAEQEDDSKHYRSLLYPESAIEKHNENNFASEVLRNEFGNRPEEEDALLPQDILNEAANSLLKPNAVTESELDTNTSVTQDWEHGKDAEEINAANAEKEENKEPELSPATEAGSESQKAEIESEADNKPAGALENLINQRALFGEQPAEEEEKQGEEEKQPEEEEKQGEEEKQPEEEEKQGEEEKQAEEEEKQAEEEEKQAEEEEKQAEEIHIEEEEDPEKEEQQEPGALEKLINQQALFGEQPKQAEEIPSEEQAEQQELEKAPEEEEAVINEGPLGYEVLVPITEDRNGCYDNVTANVDRGMPGHPLEKEIEEQESRELAEQEDDNQHYRSLLYPESAIEKHNENNFASEVLRNEFGNRPEESEQPLESGEGPLDDTIPKVASEENIEGEDALRDTLLKPLNILTQQQQEEEEQPKEESNNEEEAKQEIAIHEPEHPSSSLSARRSKSKTAPQKEPLLEDEDNGSSSAIEQEHFKDVEEAVLEKSFNDELNHVSSESNAVNDHDSDTIIIQQPLHAKTLNDLVKDQLNLFRNTNNIEEEEEQAEDEGNHHEEEAEAEVEETHNEEEQGGEKLADQLENLAEKLLEDSAEKEKLSEQLEEDAKKEEIITNKLLEDVQLVNVAEQILQQQEPQSESDNEDGLEEQKDAELKELKEARKDEAQDETQLEEVPIDNVAEQENAEEEEKPQEPLNIDIPIKNLADQLMQPKEEEEAAEKEPEVVEEPHEEEAEAEQEHTEEEEKPQEPLNIDIPLKNLADQLTQPKEEEETAEKEPEEAEVHNEEEAEAEQEHTEEEEKPQEPLNIDIPLKNLADQLTQPKEEEEVAEKEPEVVEEPHEEEAVAEQEEHTEEEEKPQEPLNIDIPLKNLADQLTQPKEEEEAAEKQAEEAEVHNEEEAEAEQENAEEEEKPQEPLNIDIPLKNLADQLTKPKEEEEVAEKEPEVVEEPHEEEAVAEQENAEEEEKPQEPLNIDIPIKNLADQLTQPKEEEETAEKEPEVVEEPHEEEAVAEQESAEEEEKPQEPLNIDIPLKNLADQLTQPKEEEETAEKEPEVVEEPHEEEAEAEQEHTEEEEKPQEPLNIDIPLKNLADQLTQPKEEEEVAEKEPEVVEEPHEEEAVAEQEEHTEEEEKPQEPLNIDIPLKNLADQLTQPKEEEETAEKEPEVVEEPHEEEAEAEQEHTEEEEKPQEPLNIDIPLKNLADQLTQPKEEEEVAEKEPEVVEEPHEEEAVAEQEEHTEEEEKPQEPLNIDIPLKNLADQLTQPKEEEEVAEKEPEVVEEPHEEEAVAEQENAEEEEKPQEPLNIDIPIKNLADQLTQPKEEEETAEKEPEEAPPESEEEAKAHESKLIDDSMNVLSDLRTDETAGSAQEEEEQQEEALKGSLLDPTQLNALLEAKPNEEEEQAAEVAEPAAEEEAQNEEQPPTNIEDQLQDAIGDLVGNEAEDQENQVEPQDEVVNNEEEQQPPTEESQLEPADQNQSVENATEEASGENEDEANESLSFNIKSIADKLQKEPEEEEKQEVAEPEQKQEEEAEPEKPKDQEEEFDASVDKSFSVKRPLGEDGQEKQPPNDENTEASMSFVKNVESDGEPTFLDKVPEEQTFSPQEPAKEDDEPNRAAPSPRRKRNTQESPRPDVQIHEPVTSPALSPRSSTGRLNLGPVLILPAERDNGGTSIYRPPSNRRKLINTAPADSPKGAMIITPNPDQVVRVSSPRSNQNIDLQAAKSTPLASSTSPRPSTTRQAPTKRTMKSTSHVLFNPPVYRSIEVSPELQKLKEKAKHGEPLNNVTTEQFQELIYVLNQERKSLARDHRYKEGLKCNSTINHVNKYYEMAKKKENQAVAKEEFEEVNKQFEESFKKFDEETKQLERELINNQKNRRNLLRNSHREELEQFDKRWNSEKKQRIYNKSTNHLISLRRQLSFLLIQSRFEEAEAVQKEINERTKAEEIDHAEIYQNDYDIALRNVEEKQEQENQTFEENCVIELEKFRQDRNKLRQGYLNRQLKLKTKEEIIADPDKLWAHGQAERLGNSLRSSRNSSTITPSSKMKRSDIKDSDVASLSLPPLDNRRRSARRNPKATTE